MPWMFFNLETGGSGTGLTLSHFCACHMPGPGFPSSYVVVFFCVQWVMARHDCLFCWYWWNCWPSLFKSNYGGGTQSLIVTCVLKQPQYTFLFIGSYYFRYEYALLSSFWLRNLDSNFNRSLHFTIKNSELILQ